MENVGIVFSKKDLASINVYEILIKNQKEFFKKINEKNVEIILNEEKHVFLDKIKTKKDLDCLIFISKHSSKSNKLSLLVHSVGNWNKALLGGKEKKLGKVNPLLNKIIFRNLRSSYESIKEELDEKFDVTMEATHHGPYLEKPIVFLEIGSTEKEWTNRKIGELILNVLRKSLEEFLALVDKDSQNIKNMLGVGGMHYASNFNSIQENNPNYAIGHICPKYYLENLDEEMLSEIFKKTYPRLDGVILDTKSLGKEKKRLVELFEKSGLNVLKYKSLKI